MSEVTLSSLEPYGRASPRDLWRTPTCGQPDLRGVRARGWGTAKGGGRRQASPQTIPKANPGALYPPPCIFPGVIG